MAENYVIRKITKSRDCYQVFSSQQQSLDRIVQHGKLQGEYNDGPENVVILEEPRLLTKTESVLYLRRAEEEPSDND